ncbi:TetR/AcrR family transcriptional repressor of nem operon [Bradyrhizobium sp. JR6.1]
MLDRYFLYVRGLVAEALGDTTLPPRDRLRRYLDLITGKLAHDGFTRGCLIGDFSLEASGSSEMLREQLDGIFREWRAPFAACIAEAQARREIASDFDPDALADFLLASWQGAMLRMKVERSAAALERFKTIAFQTVFKELP